RARGAAREHLGVLRPAVRARALGSRTRRRRPRRAAELSGRADGESLVRRRPREESRVRHAGPADRASDEAPRRARPRRHLARAELRWAHPDRARAREPAALYPRGDPRLQEVVAMATVGSGQSQYELTANKAKLTA